eukprot:1465_1
MSKCVALNVINFLWLKDKGYKMKCLYSNKYDHFDDKIKLISQREYAIGRSAYFGDNCHYHVYYCDVCLTVQGDYSWMYRCQKNKQTKYDSHDMCLKCIYDVTKRYQQLIGLLNHILMNDLTNDCIQTIVKYTAGDVVKLCN